MDFYWLVIVPLPILLWLLFELLRDEALPVPLPKNTIREMLELAQVRKGDVIYDLGSGDGRVVVISAKEFGAKAVGIEKNGFLVWLSRRKISKNKIGKKAKIIRNDLFKENIGKATVVTIYLSHKLTQRLKEKFKKELRKGTRIVSASHLIERWEEVKKTRTGHFYSYLYKI